MKKFLVWMAFLVLAFGLLVSFDAVYCDGQVILRHLYIDNDKDIPAVSDYDASDYTVEKPKKKTYANETVINATENPIEFSQMNEPEENDNSEILSTDVPEKDRGYEYYYPLLDEQEKAMYRILYEAFYNVESGNTIPTLDDDSMNETVVALKYDHPELFYIKDIGYTHYTLGGQIQKTVLNVTYTDSKSYIGIETKNIEDIANSILAAIPSDADDYTKVKMVYEAIIRSTDYNRDAPDNQNITSVFLYKQSVCSGYAKATQYLLNKLGIPTTFVEGQSLKNGELHAWNLCKLEDGYYYVDTTWGDPIYADDKQADPNSVSYDYLLVTTEELKRTHIIANEQQYPICNSTANNYYVREGCYLTSADENEIRAIFDRAYASGQDSVSIKCANLEIYDAARKYLVEDSGIFNMLQGEDDSVSYSEHEEERILFFYL